MKTRKLMFFFLLYAATLVFTIALECSLKINQLIGFIVLLIPLFYIAHIKLKTNAKYNNGYTNAFSALIAHSLGASVGREMVFVELASQIGKIFNEKISKSFAKAMGFNLFFLAPFSAIKFAKLKSKNEQVWIILTSLISIILNFWIFKSFKHFIIIENFTIVLLIPFFAYLGYIIGKILNTIVQHVKDNTINKKIRIIIAVILGVILFLVPEVRNYGFPGELDLINNLPKLDITILKLIVTLAFIALLFPGGYFTPMFFVINIVMYYLFTYLNFPGEIAFLGSMTIGFSVIMTSLDKQKYVLPITIDIVLFIIVSKIIS
jgi:H+/Cl- antiporter ClcA